MQLVERGFHVMAGCLTAEGIKSLVAETGRAENLDAFLFDVTKAEDIAACAERVRTRCPDGLKYAHARARAEQRMEGSRAPARGSNGRVGGRWPTSALVNNAGISAGYFIEWSSPDDFRRNIEVNYLGTVGVTLAHLPMLRRASRARVINVASVAGFTTATGMAGFSASKHAIEGFSDVLRLELKPFGISVSIMEPSFQRTNIILNVDKQIEDSFDSGRPRRPPPRVGTSADAAGRRPRGAGREARKPASAEVQEVYGREYMEHAKWFASNTVARVAIDPQTTVTAMMYVPGGPRVSWLRCEHPQPALTSPHASALAAARRGPLTPQMARRADAIAAALHRR